MVSKSVRTSGAAYAKPYCELTAEDYRIIAKRPGAVSMTRDDEIDARYMNRLSRGVNHFTLGGRVFPARRST